VPNDSSAAQPERVQAITSAEEAFWARFIGEVLDDDPVSTLRRIHEAPEGTPEGTEANRTWAALKLLSQVFLEGQGVGPEIVEMLAPSKSQQLLLTSEDIAICRAYAQSGSSGARGLTLALLLYFKETTWVTGRFSTLLEEGGIVNLLEEGELVETQDLTSEQLGSIRRSMEELSRDIWLDRIGDLRQVTVGSQPWNQGFLLAVTCHFIAAEPGPGIDPAEQIATANEAAPGLSENAWHYCKQAVSERHSNPNTREAVLSTLLNISRTEPLVRNPEPRGAMHECFAEIAEGLPMDVVAQCGKRCEEWILSEYPKHERSEPDSPELVSYQALDFDIQDPTSESDWRLLFLLSCIYHEFMDNDAGQAVLADQPHVPAEYCHVHALAIAHHMVQKESGGWTPEVIEAAWRLIQQLEYDTTEAVLAFLLFQAQVDRNDNDFDNWNRWMWLAEVLATNSGLSEDQVEAARTAAERLFPRASAIGLSVGVPEDSGFAIVTLGPWRSGDECDAEQLLGFDPLRPTSKDECDIAWFLASSYLATYRGRTGVVWTVFPPLTAEREYLRVAAEAFDRGWDEEILQNIERLIANRGLETNLIVLTLGFLVASMTEDEKSEEWIREHTQRLAENEGLTDAQIEDCRRASESIEQFFASALDGESESETSSPWRPPDLGLSTQRHYEVLGVSRDASTDEVKKAYLRRAREEHPDANPGDLGADARFKKLAAAFEVLSDLGRRADYDRFGHDG
jgi:DnaJ-domain-containing protein 1